jgi:hypothetical protein
MDEMLLHVLRTAVDREDKESKKEDKIKRERK